MAGSIRAAAAPAGLEIGKDFPMVCETCLGDSRFVRMTKVPAFEACRITGRPFQPFEWRPRRNEPPKRTVVCYEISAEKNVCQSCLNDLDYNIPMALRDSFLAAQQAAGARPEAGAISDVNKTFEFNQRLAERQAGVASSGPAPAQRLLAGASQAESEVERESSRLRLPALCLDWVKGRCARSPCTFRPCNGLFAFPETVERLPGQTRALESQLKVKGPKSVHIVDGQLQSALYEAARNAARIHKEQALRPPADPSVTTLFVLGLSADVTEKDIRGALGPFGALSRVQVLLGKSQAFAQFAERDAAESCMSALKGRAMIRGKPARLGWALKRASGETPQELDSPRQVGTKKRSRGPEGTAVASQTPAAPRHAKPARGPPRAIPLPEIVPGVPVPFGLEPGAAFPDAPEGLLDCFVALGAHPSMLRVFPQLSGPVPSVDFRLHYPAMSPAALDGNLCFNFTL